MKSFLKKIEYSLLVLFVALQTQVPFVVIQQFKEGGQGFSMGQTLLVLMIYLLIIFYALRMAKKEALLTLDFRFFKWSSVGWLALSYLMTFGVRRFISAYASCFGCCGSCLFSTDFRGNYFPWLDSEKVIS